MRSLEQRFGDLLAVLPGAESLDGFPSWPEHRGRADWLLFGRSLVIEVKTLRSDPSDRVQAIVDSYRDRPGFPIFYGTQPLRRVTSAMPKPLRDELNEELANSITRAVQ